MYDLYNEFTKGRLGNSSMLSSRTIEIRLVYQKYNVVCNLFFPCQLKIILIREMSFIA
jgi:hypothetical protein